MGYIRRYAMLPSPLNRLAFLSLACLVVSCWAQVIGTESGSGPCRPGLRRVGTACVAADAAPRPLAPLSLGDVTQRRPTLSWTLPAGFDGAVVELCSDRACSVVLETLTLAGSRARPTTDLPARAVVFWRLRGRVGSAVDTVYGPTWLFHVPAISASTGVDTSANPHLDVNGDGLDDLVVGSPMARPGGRREAGIASVFHGSARGIESTPARVLEGGAEGAQFGTSVAGAGDLNGDGYADLVVGSPIGSTGTASVFLGGPTGIGDSAARVLASTEQDSFGHSVATAGDVNGDGYADLVVGAYSASPGGRAAAGLVQVFYGMTTGVAGTAARVIEGRAESDTFGRSAAAAGDVNGDGYSDLVVGASGASPGARRGAGAASVFLGSATGLGPNAASVLEGATSGDLFGFAVASAGDVNGDGYGDLVVGAYGASVGASSSAGRASVFLGGATGVATAAARVLDGVAEADSFGFAVASAGDVDGDGYGDVAVGAFNANPGGRRAGGTVSVFRGRAMGLEGTAVRVFEGAAGSQLGHALARLGDVNGDGYGDLVVGAYSATPGGRMAAGTVSVFLGSATGFATTAAQIIEGVTARSFFGFSVAWSDDFNAWFSGTSDRRAKA